MKGGIYSSTQSYKAFIGTWSFNPFTPRVSYGDIELILTPESVDEILSCDHSNEPLSAVRSHGTIYI